MDNLLRHMRSKYSEEINREEPGNRRERYLVPQRSQSFRERKTTAGWLGRQFSRQMSRGNEFSDEGIEQATAVAAAVYAIRCVQDSETGRRKKNDDRPKTVSFPQFTNLKDQTRPSAPPPPPAPELPMFPRRFSDKDVLSDRDQESPKTGRNVEVISDQQKQKPTEKVTDSGGGGPYLEETSFSGNKPADISGGGGRTEPQKPVAVLPRPPTPHISHKPYIGPTDTKKPNPVQARPSDPRETKADLWEKTEMARIKEKYQKVEETISYWESKKKDKAMRKLEESQAVGVKRAKREKGRKRFEEDMEFIKQIAGEARAKADGKRRNDILKANQKADIIRQTGDLPVNCCC